MIRIPACLALLGLGSFQILPAQTGADPKPQPEPWVQVTAVPAWVAAPPARRDHYRFTTRGRSNLIPIAQSGAIRQGAKSGREHLVELLIPALGEAQAARFATAAMAHRQELKRVFCFETLRGNGPGNTLATAWILWEVPIRPALEAIDPALRGRAERALLTTPPPWQEVKEEPAWFRQPAQRKGWFRLGLQHHGVWQRDARRKAVAAATADVKARLVELLTPALGATAAERAADAAVEDLRPVHRALQFTRLPKPNAAGEKYRTFAWVVWEVSVDRMQRAVGEQLAAKLGAALDGSRR